MKSKTQLAWVKSTLRQNGKITRNEALRNYCSRLGAIINKINKEPDWEIKGEYGENGDYVYKVKMMPRVRKVEIINGRAVEIIEQKKLL